MRAEIYIDRVPWAVRVKMETDTPKNRKHDDASASESAPNKRGNPPSQMMLPHLPGKKSASASPLSLHSSLSPCLQSKIALSPCNNYRPVTIICPCPEVVIISDILCTDVKGRKEGRGFRSPVPISVKLEFQEPGNNK